MADIIKIKHLLIDLENNNNRDWFQTHRAERNAATFEFECFLAEIIDQIQQFDDSISTYLPNELTFKQVRDTRYSKNKTPYLPAFRAHIGPKGKVPIPVGYFICLQPNNKSFIGGGLFTDFFPDATKKIRDHIYTHETRFHEIISNPLFKVNFQVCGEKLKRVPKPFDPNSTVAEYLKHKSWYLEYPIMDAEFENPKEFLALIIEKFKLMKDFNHFLNEALVDFQLPERKL